ncbi:MAG: universal stress protein [Acidimicrobiales bacterium]
MGTIVVGVDGSDGAASALRWAVMQGRLRGWPIEAVLAWGFLDQHHTILGERFDPQYAPDDAKQALDSYVEAAIGATDAATVERRIVSDLPARALLHAAAGAELLVVGARGLGGFRGLLLGSVSQRCLHESTCPVAVIRLDDAGDLRDAPQRVVVGIDGSRVARPALHWAIGEARAREAVLEVVHAWQPPFVGGFPMTGTTIDYSAFEDAARQAVAVTLDEADLTGLKHPVEQTVVSLGASTALLEAGRRAQMTVVGARGLGALTRMLLGSVSHQVTLHATNPVVVVPDTEG